MATKFPVTSLLLQGDMDAQGYTIHNLNKSGLLLVKGDVGLGNVDNTADVDKPASTATLIAIGDKEDRIPLGAAGQFWIGTKQWQNFGALALQEGTTGLPILSSIASSANSVAIIRANRHDTAASVALRQVGESAFGSVMTGVPLANVGILAFDGCANAVIKTSNVAPIMFGYNGILRMRIRLGLDMGDAIADPGAGCINAYGTITAGQFVGPGSGITGIVAGQIPATLNATLMPSLVINGEVGLGYIKLGAQTSAPSVAGNKIYANSAGQISLFSGITATKAAELSSEGLTANRLFTFLDVAGSIPVITAVPASASAAGVAGQEAYDSGHFYKCIATNTWQRSTLATW